MRQTSHRLLMSPAIRAGLGTRRSGWFLIRLPWLPRARNPQPLCMSTAIQALQPEVTRLRAKKCRVKDICVGRTPRSRHGRVSYKKSQTRLRMTGNPITNEDRTLHERGKVTSLARQRCGFTILHVSRQGRAASGARSGFQSNRRRYENQDFCGGVCSRS